MKSSGKRAALRRTSSLKRGDLVERGEVGIEQDLVAAYEEDAALDALDRDDRTLALAYPAPPEPKSTQGDGLR
jgi:hypothetical protein